MERTTLAHPTIVFGGDIDILELIDRISLYSESHKHDVFINGVLSCQNNWKPQEVYIPGNLEVNGIYNSKLILRIAGNLKCNGRINIGILKVQGDVFCEDSVQVFDLTAKGGVHIDGVLDGQIVIIGKDLSVNQENHFPVHVNSLKVNGNIYCNGPMEGDSLLASGDVYCMDYMDIPHKKIKGKTFIEKQNCVWLSN